MPITLEECREHRALSEAAQPERLPPTWYNSHSPSGFGGATAFCESKGRRLVTHSEYCAAGSVFGGKKSDGNQWAPCSGDGDNQWVQVGTGLRCPPGASCSKAALEQKIHASCTTAAALAHTTSLMKIAPRAAKTNPTGAMRPRV